MPGFPINPANMESALRGFETMGRAMRGAGQRSTEGFRLTWMPDGPIRHHTAQPSGAVPIFKGAHQSNGWLPGLNMLADEMDAAAKHAEHRDQSSRRHLLRPARVTP